MELDRFDRRLLNLVQQDAGQTAGRLAEQVGLSASAVQRRLRRLRENGTIVRDTVIVDPKRVGSPAFFVASLEVERERPELLAELRAWIAAQERIQQAFYVTGGTDFVLVVTAPDTESYDAFMSRLMDQNANVKRFGTNVVLGQVKQGFALPVREDGDA